MPGVNAYLFEMVSSFREGDGEAEEDAFEEWVGICFINLGIQMGGNEIRDMLAPFFLQITDF